MRYVLSLTKGASVLQHREEMPELVFWRTASACLKFSAVVAQLLLPQRCLNWGVLCGSPERGGSQGNLSDSHPGSESSDSPLLGIGLVCLGLVPMESGGYKSPS